MTIGKGTKQISIFKDGGRYINKLIGAEGL